MNQEVSTNIQTVNSEAVIDNLEKIISFLLSLHIGTKRISTYPQKYVPVLGKLQAYILPSFPSYHLGRNIYLTYTWKAAAVIEESTRTLSFFPYTCTQHLYLSISVPQGSDVPLRTLLDLVQ